MQKINELNKKSKDALNNILLDFFSEGALHNHIFNMIQKDQQIQSQIDVIEKYSGEAYNTPFQMQEYEKGTKKGDEIYEAIEEIKNIINK